MTDFNALRQTVEAAKGLALNGPDEARVNQAAELILSGIADLEAGLTLLEGFVPAGSTRRA